jgi:hypothetical protein
MGKRKVKVRHVAKGGTGRVLGGAQSPLTSVVENYVNTITFFFCNCSVKFFGTCNILLERCFQDFSNGILQAPKSLKFQLVKPTKKMQSFSDCKAGWSKEPQAMGKR